MLRQLATKRTIATRGFSVSRAALTEQPSKSDAFKERESAQENAYVKKHEAEQLRKLREKLDEQKKVVDQLEKEIKEMKK